MKNQSLYFSVDDKLLGEKISLDNTSLPLLLEFAEQVSSFLRGSTKVDLKEVRTSIREGSLALSVDEPVATLEDATKDYELIMSSHSLEGVDPVRARVMSEWQATASKNQDRVYKLLFQAFGSKGESPLVISSETNYVVQQDTWVNAERYVYGRVYDLGGKNQPNVHLSTEDGKTIKAQTNINVLAEDKVNRLYRRQLVRIKAEQNLTTKDYRNETLVSFEKYNPHFDEDDFLETVKQGRIAWRSVDNATQWVEELRGNYA